MQKLTEVAAVVVQMSPPGHIMRGQQNVILSVVWQIEDILAGFDTARFIREQGAQLKKCLPVMQLYGIFSISNQ